MRRWIDFWNEETIATHNFSHKNMEIFFRTSSKIINYNKNDIILDIGCGKGLLASFLKDNVKEIYCLDTSKRNIQIVKEKFKRDRSVNALHLSEDYLDFSFLESIKFTKVIVNSVIQYYASLEEVEKLIIETRKISADNAILLISDIPIETNIFKNIFELLIGGMKERILWESLKYIWNCRTSEYCTYRKELDLLEIAEKDLTNIADKLDLKYCFLPIQLSLSLNRKHFLIYLN